MARGYASLDEGPPAQGRRRLGHPEGLDLEQASMKGRPLRGGDPAQEAAACSAIYQPR